MHSPPPGAIQTGLTGHVAKLVGVSSEDLVRELLARVGEGNIVGNDAAMMALGQRLVAGLGEQVDVIGNRFAAEHYCSLVHSLHATLPMRLDLEGKTVVDIGCGGTNPLGFLFVLMALGAQRGIAIDLDQVGDFARAVRALAEIATLFFLQPEKILGPGATIDEKVMRRLAAFHLPGLAAGQLAAADAQRLQFRRESATATSLADGEADVVYSCAFLEHLPDVPAVLREVARITRPRGIGVHMIDLTDHRRYSGDVHPLAFLADPPAAMLHGSNRLRRTDFLRAFETAGFEILQCAAWETTKVSDAMRATFAAPFRNLPQEELEVIAIRVTVAKR